MKKIYSLLAFIIAFINVNAQSWTNLHSPGGANTGAIDATSNYLFLGTTAAKLQRSSNSGNTWDTLTPSGCALAMNLILFTTKTGALIMGGLNASYVKKFYRSNDHGNNFTIINDTLDGTNVKVSNNGTIILYNKSTLADSYISTDDGLTWSYLDKYQTTLRYTKDVAFSGTSIFALRSYNTNIILYKSVDNGSTWTIVNGTNQPTLFESILSTPNGDLYLYGYSIVIAKSTDQGATWTTPLANKKPANLYSDANGNLFASAASVCERSANGGVVWANIIDGFSSPATNIGMFFAHSNGSVYAGTAYGEMYKYTGTGGSNGIFESKINDSEISLYPNPAVNEINFDIKKINSKINGIKIFDVTGKLIKEENTNTNKLDVSSLKKGIYLLTILFEDKTNINQKFVKE